MKVLVLGCGEMGEKAIEDIYQYGPFDEMGIGCRSLDKANTIITRLKGNPIRITAIPIDLNNDEALVALMKEYEVVVNCVGPNYKYEYPIARMAIAAKVNLVDINDDYETTLKMLELDEEARVAGITVVLGMGASPGVNNILVRAAADQLDEVDEIHTAWVMSGADPGGLALSYHLLYSLSRNALTFQDGRLLSVRSFVDGRERIDFPEPVGSMDVFHIGHPEPITLSRYFQSKGVKYVDDKATFNPPVVNDWIVSLGQMAHEATGPVNIGGQAVDAMDFAVSYFRQKCMSLKNIPLPGAVRVVVKGRKDGKKKNMYFSSSARIAFGTGIPAAIGAIMLAKGEITRKGVLPPEECVAANDFIFEMINRRNVATLNGWIEE
jgi:saccharopine dehydrogenase-like NADP-dependent oxidoreductase